MHRLLLALLVCSVPVVAPAEVREQAVVDLSFDEESGDAVDRGAGDVASPGKLRNGASRVPSPFWNQRDGRAVRVERGRTQFVEVADGPDTDRPDGVSVSLFFVNLLPETEQSYRGLFGKRSNAEPRLTNYGVNYGRSDTLQVYLNSGAGFRVVQYPLGATLGYRRLVHVTLTWEVADAPGTDADEDRDDVRIRMFVNGQPAKPKASANGFIDGNDGWIVDANPAGMLNDVALTIGSTNTTIEPTEGVVDEVLVFDRALTPAEAATLFTEVAGENGPELAKLETAPAPVVPVPEIATITPRVLRLGESNRLTITGKNLADGSLLIPGLDFEQTVVEGSNAGRLIVDVTPRSTEPARVPVRVATPRGVSTVRPVSLTPLTVVPVTAATAEKPASIPAAFHGSVAGAQSVRVHVVGRAGQKLVADVEGRRLGSGFSPVVEVKTDRGTPLAIEWSKVALRGDTRAEVELPADGVYVVEVHDLTYKAPGRNDFVLRIGEGPHASAPRDDPPTFGRVVEEGTDPVDAAFTGAAHVPVLVRGVLSEPGEEDRHVLDVTPNQTLELRLRGRAIDSSIDGVLAVLAEPGGNQLAYAEDEGANRDPRLVYKVPGNVKRIAVAVRDLHRHGGPDHRYELRILPTGQPNFSLEIEDRAVTLPRAGNAVVRLKVARQGYNGPIRLHVDGDDHVTPVPAVVPAGYNGTTFVTLARTEGATDGSKTIAIVGESDGLTPALVRHAEVQAATGDVHTRTSNLRIPLTTTDAAPLTVTVADLPAALFKGAIGRPNVTVERTDALADRSVRLTLLTNEAPRLVDPKDAKKGNKPLVRSQSGLVLHAGEAAGSLPVLVPLDVAVGSVDAVVRAEIVRHAYSDVVLATAYSAPFRLPVQPAISIEVDAASLTFPANEPTTIRGTITRTAGFDDPVVLDAIDLPNGWTAEAFPLPPGETAFTVRVVPPKPDFKADPKAKPNPQLRARLANGRDLVAPMALKVSIAKPK